MTSTDSRVVFHRLNMALVPLCLVVLSVFVLSFASAADEPVQFGNDQIGMTSEGLAQASGESRGKIAPVESEWHDGAAADGAPLSAANNQGPAASNYEDCVELAIRSGNGFRAASGVCQALFLGGPSSATNQVPAPVATEDEGPLLLTLPPSTAIAEEPSAPEAEPEDQPVDDTAPAATETEQAEQADPAEQTHASEAADPPSEASAEGGPAVQDAPDAPSEPSAKTPADG